MNGTRVLSVNIFANYLGKIWIALMTIIFLPIYLEYLGPESYGLVGLYASLQLIFTIFELGLNTTINREMAQYSSSSNMNGQAMIDLMKSFEYVYLCLGVCVGVVIFFFSSDITSKWFNNFGALNEVVVQDSLQVIAVIISVKLVFSLYSNALMGLQKQVVYNKVLVFFASLKSFGAVFVLLYLSQDIRYFLLWFFFVEVFQVLVLYFFLWSFLPGSRVEAKFSLDSLVGVKAYALNTFGVTVLAVAVGQADKLMVSKTLNMEVFGYYSFSVVLAGVLLFLVYPVNSALFPRYSELFRCDRKEDIRSLYMDSSTLLGGLLWVCCFMIFFYSKEILFLWGLGAASISQIQPILTLLIFGVTLNALYSMPYTLQLACAKLRLPFYLNLIGVMFYIPLLYFLVALFGVEGAALGWSILYGFFLLVTSVFFHSEILKALSLRWALQTIVFPVILSFIIIGGAREIFLPIENKILLFVFLMIVFVCSLFFIYLCFYSSRKILFHFLNKLLSRKKVV